MNKKLQVTTYGHDHTIQKLHETNSIANAKLFRYVLLNSYEKPWFLMEVLRSTDAIFCWYIIITL